jgi:hypothetical protein
MDSNDRLLVTEVASWASWRLMDSDKFKRNRCLILVRKSQGQIAKPWPRFLEFDYLCHAPCATIDGSLGTGIRKSGVFLLIRHFEI